MDKILPPKPWYLRYKYYLVCAIVTVGLIIYALTLALGPSRMRINQDDVKTGEAKKAPFLEYVDVEGHVEPIRTLRVNTRESGSVVRIVAEEGQSLHEGDTILVLTNPELERTIEDLRDDLEEKHTAYEEQKIEQEKLRLQLRKQTLQAHYERQRLDKNIRLDREEHSMGIKSKAQLEVAEDEYRYQQERTRLEILSLRNDSASAILKGHIMERNLEREQKKYQHARERLDHLVVVAPCDGQLSYISPTLGQRVGDGELVAEIKVLTDYKVHASLNEYYIDRIVSGLPANIRYQNKLYPLHITKVVPEVRDRSFDIDLVFEGKQPENIRVGKSYRLQIELGKAEEALVIPRGDFYQATAGEWIFRVDPTGTKAVRTPITVGRQNPSQYEIIEGLQPGDRVITSGYDRLGDVEMIVLK